MNLDVVRTCDGRMVIGGGMERLTACNAYANSSGLIHNMALKSVCLKAQVSG